MRERKGKIALFVDGSNLRATTKALGFELDYKRLLAEFGIRGILLRAFYFTAVAEDQDYSSVRPLLDWLCYNGFTVVTKPVKEFVDSEGRRKLKGNMDVDIAVRAMEMSDHVDQFILFSGDGNLRSLVEALQRRGAHVSVVSTIATQPPMASDELRRQADQFIELAELRLKIGREAPASRTGPREQVASPFFRRQGAVAPRATDGPAQTAPADERLADQSLSTPAR